MWLYWAVKVSIFIIMFLVIRGLLMCPQQQATSADNFVNVVAGNERLFSSV